MSWIVLVARLLLQVLRVLAMCLYNLLQIVVCFQTMFQCTKHPVLAAICVLWPCATSEPLSACSVGLGKIFSYHDGV